MKHTGTVRLETERLILRRFKTQDADMMFNNWASDSEVTKYLTWPHHSDVSVTKQILSMWVNDYMHSKFYQWGIELKETGELIGGISLVKIDDEEKKVEAGYTLSRKYWNKGITTEALKEVIRFCFDELEVKEVTARFDEENIASGKVMEKCGMTYTHDTLDKNNIHKLCVCKNYSIKK